MDRGRVALGSRQQALSRGNFGAAWILFGHWRTPASPPSPQHEYGHTYPLIDNILTVRGVAPLLCPATARATEMRRCTARCWKPIARLGISTAPWRRSTSWRCRCGSRHPP
eukprot:352213-Chlamydomonas_euryale.AAC.4